ncbi:MAG: rhodanese-like domain-containing protein [Verrucomicrobiaceae bacterium]|nr:rhodanese-like domain-containing protein [Verrucomicrobiaceae bacterium]
MRLLPLLTPLLLVGCDPAPKTAPRLEPPALILPASVKELTPDEAETFLTAQPAALIIDARMLEELKNHGHIARAQNIDFLNEKAAAEALQQLDKSRPALVYCAIGGRARQMAVQMAGIGFKDVKVLAGGFNAWVAAGKPVTR